MIRHGRSRHGAILIGGIVLVFVLAACGAARPIAPTPEPLSGTYTASGGGGALPAVQALTARFKELNPGVNWIVTESGSNAAIKLLLSNTIDVGFVSRALTDAEKQTVTPTPIGFAGTAVIVNPANPLKNLTRDQLRQIYTGDAKTWADLGWTEPTIRPYIREKNADTRQTFEAYLFAGSVVTYGKRVAEHMEREAMLDAVNSCRGSYVTACIVHRCVADARR